MIRVMPPSLRSGGLAWLAQGDRASLPPHLNRVFPSIPAGPAESIPASRAGSIPMRSAGSIPAGSAEPPERGS